ncbi:uncharacterized protein UV8b_07842 [Ustilaginoidea virens]|uniref:Uncharacterized protein n=1 Tax=Ustilaginoidea virens TaxID=1159556 RepID=A0A8E5ML67_USTVR|nr:uncharacterized protein UV8b_07842 [Ustilaginoidea virens]QUC23601.1 hypothetical protein UV8b_07842 [Ustilaginoidea virens]
MRLLRSILALAALLAAPLAEAVLTANVLRDTIQGNQLARFDLVMARIRINHLQYTADYLPGENTIRIHITRLDGTQYMQAFMGNRLASAYFNAPQPYGDSRRRPRKGNAKRS